MSLVPDGDNAEYLQLVGDVEDVAYVFDRLLPIGGIASVDIGPAGAES